MMKFSEFMDKNGEDKRKGSLLESKYEEKVISFKKDVYIVGWIDDYYHNKLNPETILVTGNIDQKIELLAKKGTKGKLKLDYDVDRRGASLDWGGGSLFEKDIDVLIKKKWVTVK